MDGFKFFMSLFVTILIMSCSTEVLADSKQRFMPENNLYLEDNYYRTNITQDEFNAMLDRAEAHYKPIIAAMGKNFQLIRKWEDSTVNAYAQQSGNNWMVTMFGGMARRSEMNAAGFALVACHEIGHHLGGYPYYSDARWAANEGQSDYFSTFVCAKKVFAGMTAGTINKNARQKCDSKYSSDADRNLCYMAVWGGQSLGDLLAALGGSAKPNYDTPDQSVNKSESHPKAQCRLDTYLAGALCSKAWNDRVIPQNADATCNTRPKCWYGEAGQDTDGGQPSPEPTPVPPAPNPDETDLFTAVNNKRVSVGATKLERHTTLECAAKMLADYAAKNGKCGTTIDGLNTQQRIRLCGCDWMIGESRQPMACYFKTPASAVDAWYAEKTMTHYITSPSWKRLGCAKSGDYYVCTFNNQK